MASILHVAASYNYNGASRTIAQKVITKLQQGSPAFANSKLIQRDATLLPQLPHEAMDVWFSEDSDRTPAQREKMTLSNELVAEAKSANVLVISTPVHNFGGAIGLKAWVDHVIRVGETVVYNTDGKPEGQLSDKKVVVVVSAGGTAHGSDRDGLSPWLNTALGFVGVKPHYVWQVGDSDEAQAATEATIKDLVASFSS